MGHKHMLQCFVKMEIIQLFAKITDKENKTQNLFPSGHWAKIQSKRPECVRSSGELFLGFCKNCIFRSSLQLAGPAGVLQKQSIQTLREEGMLFPISFNSALPCQLKGCQLLSARKVCQALSVRCLKGGCRLKQCKKNRCQSMNQGCSEIQRGCSALMCLITEFLVAVIKIEPCCQLIHLCSNFHFKISVLLGVVGPPRFADP